MEQSREVLDYLRAKYLRGRDVHTDKLNIFDPWINPDEGHIPYCAECLENFNEYKKRKDETNVCKMDHSTACLWYDYFEMRIKRLNPKAVLVLKTEDEIKNQRTKNR